MADAYDLWRAELAEPTPEADRHTRIDTPELIAGFWRILSARTKPSHPVAIWPDDGSAGPAVFFKIGVGARDGESLFNTVTDPERVDEFKQSTWFKCIAVSEADYHSAMASGRWPDNTPARQMSAEEKLDLVPDTPPSEGGNNPIGEDGQPIDLFHEQVTTKIAAQLEKVKELKWPFKTLDEANAAAAIVETLRALGKQGETKRKEEVAPFDEGRARVQAKWVPHLDPASKTIKNLVDAIQGFRDAEEARLKREQEERDKIERERLEAENRKMAESYGTTVDENALKEMVDQQMAATPAPIITAPRVGTAHGRGISAPKTKTATITDPKALALHLVETGDADLMECLQKRVNAAARAKITLPGTRIDP